MYHSYDRKQKTQHDFNIIPLQIQNLDFPEILSDRFSSAGKDFIFLPKSRLKLGVIVAKTSSIIINIRIVNPHPKLKHGSIKNLLQLLF